MPSRSGDAKASNQESAQASDSDSATEGDDSASFSMSDEDAEGPTDANSSVASAAASTATNPTKENVAGTPGAGTNEHPLSRDAQQKNAVQAQAQKMSMKEQAAQASGNTAHASTSCSHRQVQPAVATPAANQSNSVAPASATKKVSPSGTNASMSDSSAPLLQQPLVMSMPSLMGGRCTQRAC